MIFLYFLLDVAFYNYTAWSTHIFLITFLEKKKKNLASFFLALLIDYLLAYKGKFFLIFLVLYILNRELKISYDKWTSVFFRFFLLFVSYHFLTLLLFHQIVFDPIGLGITILFVGFSYKNSFRS